MNTLIAAGNLDLRRAGAARRTYVRVARGVLRRQTLGPTGVPARAHCLPSLRPRYAGHGHNVGTCGTRANASKTGMPLASRSRSSHRQRRSSCSSACSSRPWARVHSFRWSLAASGDGGPHAVERDFLRRAFRPRWDLPVAPVCTVVCTLFLGSGVLVLLGLVTAVHASLIARVQVDAKSQLAYATMAQLGLMCIELGLGFPRLATVHLLAHAIFRAWQFLRAPGSLRSLVQLSAQLEGRPVASAQWLQWLPTPWRERLWFFALERFHLESTQEHWILRPLLRTGRLLDSVERRWDAALLPSTDSSQTSVSTHGSTP